MELGNYFKSTEKYMNSPDWQERIIAEYLQTKIRYDKLIDYISRKGTDSDVVVDDIMIHQAEVMAIYLNCLRIRALSNGIDLVENYSRDNKVLAQNIINAYERYPHTIRKPCAICSKGTDFANCGDHCLEGVMEFLRNNDGSKK